MNDMSLIAKVRARELRLRRTLDMTILRVEVIDDWNWWFKKGMLLNVKRYPFQADRECNLNCCYCSDCISIRSGHKMYELYEVADGAHEGSIIPIVATRCVK